MQRKKFIKLVVLIVMSISINACNVDMLGTDRGTLFEKAFFENAVKDNIPTLTADTWTDGNLPTSSDVQWFKFTATASTQYIHFNPGTLNSLYIQVYDSSGATVGSSINYNNSSNSVSRTVTVGQKYYIRVLPPYNSSYSGTYRIAFNTTFYPPDVTITTLTANTWTDGNLPTSSYVQWFKFTATASRQYIHFNPGTLNSFYQVYDSSGDTVYSYSNRCTVTVGQEYYIKVRPYSFYTGTYRIAFNTTFYPPDVTITTLTANTWTDGNLPTSSDVQWFKFTATTSTQNIHFNPGTLNSLYIQVYDSSGATVGSSTNLYNNSSNRYVSRTVTVGQEYYIRVSPYSSSYSGTYQIGFNTSSTPPSLITLPATAIQITANTWTDGNLPTSSSVQWFKFTATASTQYIHVSFGTLTDLYVQVYDSSGATVGYSINLSSSGATYFSMTVTVGQEYYIKVSPYSSSYSGTYQIMFNTSYTLPITLPATAIQLAANTWAGGNLPTSSDVQWFKFIATASMQYIHVSFGTLTDLYVQVYDSGGFAVINQANLYGSTRYVSITIAVGQEYYIKVWPYSTNNNGTYRIGFNTSSTPPS